MNKCVGAILAGGDSSRMDQDKASLKLNGTPLLLHTEKLLQRISFPKIYINSPKHIPDIYPKSGPLSGIHTLLSHDNGAHKHILIVPVDMPGLTPTLLKKLVEAPDQADLVCFSGNKLPFRLSSKMKWRILAEELLRDKSQCSVGYFQSQISERLIFDASPQDKNCFVNINTARDWQQFTSGTNNETQA